MSKSTTSSPVSNPGFIPAGTAIVPQPDGKPIPSLFQPIKIRGTTFQNRIFVSNTMSRPATRVLINLPQVSPLSQYSSDNGKLTPWHMTHRKSITVPKFRYQYVFPLLKSAAFSLEVQGLLSSKQQQSILMDVSHLRG